MKKTNHTIRAKNRDKLYIEWICNLFPGIPNGATMSDRCKKEITVLINKNSTQSSTFQNNTDQEYSSDYSNKDISFLLQSKVAEAL